MPWRRVAAATRLFGRDRRASGVGLKAITHWTTEYLEFVDATGCGKDQKENDLWRRLESADTWDVGKANRSWDKYCAAAASKRAAAAIGLRPRRGHDTDGVAATSRRRTGHAATPRLRS